MIIFLTHKPCEIDEIYSREAIEELKKFGEVRLNPYERHLSSGELQKIAFDVDIIISEWDTGIDRNYIEKAKNLKAFIRCGVEIRNVDFEAAAEADIIIANTPGLYVNPVVEYTIGLIISINRNITRYHNALKNGVILDKVLTPELYGKTLTLIGVGAIGLRVADVARAMGMRVIAYDPYAGDIPGIELKELGEAIKEADFISMHAKWTRETEKLIGIRELELMKPTAYIVNTARGALIDEEALYNALKSGRIAGAALDVFAAEPEFLGNKLLELSNVLVTPHIAGYSPETFKRQAMATVEIVKDIEEGRTPKNIIDLKLINSQQ